MSFSISRQAIVIAASAAMELLVGNDAWLARWRGWNEAGDILVVPAHFGHEVANALLVGLGLPVRAATAAIDRLFASGLDVVDRGVEGFQASIHLADEHGLTVYDAAYLDLAIELDGELATLDRDLRKAATGEDVPLVE